MVEAGLKADAVYPFYTAAYLPAKTPHAIAEKLYAEITKALAMPSVQQRLTAVGVDPMPMTMAESATGAVARPRVRTWRTSLPNPL